MKSHAIKMASKVAKTIDVVESDVVEACILLINSTKHYDQVIPALEAYLSKSFPAVSAWLRRIHDFFKTAKSSANFEERVVQQQIARITGSSELEYSSKRRIVSDNRETIAHYFSYANGKGKREMRFEGDANNLVKRVRNLKFIDFDHPSQEYPPEFELYDIDIKLILADGSDRIEKIAEACVRRLKQEAPDDYTMELEEKIGRGSFGNVFKLKHGKKRVAMRLTIFDRKNDLLNANSADLFQHELSMHEAAAPEIYGSYDFVTQEAYPRAPRYVHVTLMELCDVTPFGPLDLVENVKALQAYFDRVTLLFSVVRNELYVTLMDRKIKNTVSKLRVSLKF